MCGKLIPSLFVIIHRIITYLLYSEDLDPCSLYSNIVTLKAIDDEVAKVIDQPISAYTGYAGERVYCIIPFSLYFNLILLFSEPQTNLVEVNTTETTITIAWQTSDRACVKHYEISAVATGDTQSSQRLKDESVYTFTSALPCRTYNVTMYTVNNESSTIDTDSELKDTLYLEPGELTLTMTNRSNGDTRVTWKEPANQSCVRSYTFVWRRNDCKTEDNEETTTTTAETTTEWAVTGSETDVPGSGTREFEESTSNYDDDILRRSELSSLCLCLL